MCTPSPLHFREALVADMSTAGTEDFRPAAVPTRPKAPGSRDHPAEASGGANKVVSSVAWAYSSTLVTVFEGPGA